MYPDPAIRQIYHRSGNVKIGGYPANACTVTDALDSPADKNLYGFHRYIPCMSFIASPSSSNTSSRSEDCRMFVAASMARSSTSWDAFSLPEAWIFMAMSHMTKARWERGRMIRASRTAFCTIRLAVLSSPAFRDMTARSQKITASSPRSDKERTIFSRDAT